MTDRPRKPAAFSLPPDATARQPERARPDEQAGDDEAADVGQPQQLRHPRDEKSGK